MRITGGQARGRKIGSPPSGGQVRPTASKIRQALFNIIGTRVIDARFLDICAGSGLVGLEAMSRGAVSLVSVEHDRTLALNLNNSAKRLGYEIKILALDLRTALPLLRGQQFDLIFADPPYKSNLTDSILASISKHNLLCQKGLLIVEHANGAAIDLKKTSLIRCDTRAYGQSALSFFTGWTDGDA